MCDFFGTPWIMKHCYDLYIFSLGIQNPSAIHFNGSHSPTNDTLLKFAKVSSDDAGLYECTADNGIQPTIRTNFTITILGMILIFPEYFYMVGFKHLMC